MHRPRPALRAVGGAARGRCPRAGTVPRRRRRSAGPRPPPHPALSASPSTGPSGFRADVQGLRGVAVLLVVVFHTGLALPGGSIGVDVFFVISGFVITRLLASDLDEERRPSFATFYARRARRLLPMLAVTLAATAAAGYFLLSPLGPAATTARTAAAAALLNANTYLALQPQGYFDLDPTENALLHTWSLSVEEQFYLFFPALLVVLWRRWSRRTALLGLAGVATASFGLALVAGPAWMFYSAPTRAWEFLAGALLALGARRIDRTLPHRARLVLAAAGAVFVAWSALAFDGELSFTAWHAAAAVAGAAALLVGAPRALAWRPLVVLGDLSYGWYLLHWPFIVFTVARTDHRWAPAAAALGSLAVAAVAHRAVENPIRFDARIVGRRAAALAVACVVVPVAAGTLVASIDRDASDHLERATRESIVYELGCHEGGSPVAADADADAEGACTFESGATESRGEVLLLGDSHAAALAEPVVAAGNDLGFDVTVATHSACPFVADLALRRVESGGGVGTALAGCEEHVEEVLVSIEAAAEPPAIVVLAGAAPRYLDGSYELSVDAGPWIGDDTGRAEAWSAGLASTLARLDAAGVATLVVHDNPYPELSPLRCDRFADLAECTSFVDADAAEAVRRVAVEVEAAAVASVPSAATLDPLPVLCPGGRCPNIAGGVWLYRDDHHLSIDGALRLEPLFRDALDRLGAIAP